jgi:adenylylsulfate kinase
MKGVYVVVIWIAKDISVSIGALGDKSFRRGLYAYVGSAQNNLEKRLGRHVGRIKAKFWHIDYLLSSRETEVVRMFYKMAGRPEECKVARRLAEIATSVTGFGSSDCSCKSHLFRLEAYDYLSRLMRELRLEPFRGMVSMGKTGWCVWITGLPGSGKSTVSDSLIKLLANQASPAQLLSSDALRRVMTPKPSYSVEERDTVYATLVYIAELLTRNGVNIVIDATGNLRRYRENARRRIPTFIEVYLQCPPDVCTQREAARAVTHHAPKRIYEKAKEGKAPTVPGVGQPYEAPSNPEITLDTTKFSPEECAWKVLETVLCVQARDKGRP